MSDESSEDGPASDYFPFWVEQREVEPDDEGVEPPKTATTRSSNAIAVLPAIALAVDVWIYAQGQISWTQIIIVGLVFDFGAYALARRDQKRLRELRITIPTSPRLALIAPPIYLFVRGTRAWREAYTGYRPAWLSVLVAVIIMFALAMLPAIFAGAERVAAAWTFYGI